MVDPKRTAWASPQLQPLQQLQTLLTTRSTGCATGASSLPRSWQAGALGLDGTSPFQDLPPFFAVAAATSSRAELGSQGNWGGWLPVAGEPGHFHQGQTCLLENAKAAAA